MMREKPFRPLRWRLFFLVALVSGVATAVIVVTNYRFDLENEERMMDQSFRQIEITSTAAIATAAWNIDRAQIAAALAGMIQIDDLVRVRVLDDAGEEIGKAEKPRNDGSSEIARDFALQYEQDGQKRNVGTLQVVASRFHMDERLRKRFLFLLTSQVLQNAVLSALILAVVQLLVTRRVRGMKAFFETYDSASTDPTKRTMQMPPIWRSRDEIDDLIVNVNEMSLNILNFLMQIQEHNRTLEMKVEERTAQLREKTEEVIAILNSLHQGIFIVASDGRVRGDYSKFLENILEHNAIADQPIDKVLLVNAVLSADQASTVSAALQNILGENEFNLMLNFDHLPRELRFAPAQDKIKILEIDWYPLIVDGLVAKLLVSLRDVTDLRALQLVAQESARELTMVGEILSSKEQEFAHFIVDSHAHFASVRGYATLGADRAIEDMATMYRHIHTVKGNSRTLSLKALSSSVHDLESFLDKIRAQPSLWAPEAFSKLLNHSAETLSEYERVGKEKLGRSANAASPAQGMRDQLAAIYQRLAHMPRVTLTDLEKALNFVKSQIRLIFKPPLGLSGVLEKSVRVLAGLARELGKPAPNVEIADGNVLFQEQAISPLNDIFGHILRNSLDHGLEDPAARINAGKSERGLITIRAVQSGEGIVIDYRDDGGGLDLSRIKSKAVDLGLLLPAEQSPEAIAQAIFHSGFSTKTEVTMLSGRGVGMDAVREFANDLGGNVEIILGDLDTGSGRVAFSFRLYFPVAGLADLDAESDPRQAAA